MLRPDGPAAHGYGYYVEMAENVVAGAGLHRTMPYGQGERWAIRTPGYPLLLAAVLRAHLPLGPMVALIGALCGATTCLLARAVAMRLCPASATAVGWCAALWPQAVVHDGALQDTALYTCLFLAFVLVNLRWAFPGERRAIGREQAMHGHVLAGALGALAILVRAPLVIPVVALLLHAALGGSLPLARRLRRAALAVVVLLACLTPWFVRNALVVGEPVLTSDTGRSLWLGNNPETFSVYPGQSIDRAEERAWAAIPAFTRSAVRCQRDDELRQDRWFLNRAEAWVIDHPQAALIGAARKAWATFSPWFNPRGPLIKQIVHLFSYGPVALLAVVGSFAFRRRPESIACRLVAASLALQSAVFFGHSSYRAPVDPLLIVVACAGVVWLHHRWCKAAPA